MGRAFEEGFSEHYAAGLEPARVVRVDGGRCDTLTASGPVRADSVTVGSLDPAHTVCTGDWATLLPGVEPELVALLPLPDGGVLIDTPGLRGIGLQDATDRVERVFSDIEAYAKNCGFRDCEHRSEPGCAVQDAVIAGLLDMGCLDRYRKLLRESEWASARGDARNANKRGKNDKAIARDLRVSYRFRERQQ